jgi:uncharacterized protein (DUF305 family)
LERPDDIEVTDEGLDPVRVSLARVVTLVLVACFFGGAVGFYLGVPRPPGASSVDVGFYRDMTVHHDQGITLAAIELANGSDPTIRGFAQEIILEQRWELGRMYQELRDWNAELGPADPAMTWMGMSVPAASMPGLATDDQISALRGAEGSAADALFLELMAEHHRGGVHMASYAAEHAEGADVRALAATMARNQGTEINEFIQTAKRIGLAVDIQPFDAP